ncbi:hypothetical protein U0C82_05810 [Fulvimarina sp. 2208YS6-2-32]|uniref:Ceramidase n=1 Tax=Fulvimarina uroteuthidis TaxID=3098149 RepID=A0ABU5I1M7_9HYPH|nr:ceramidase domain-containing protein [Fulvimarina sp. 2208YS6-2-32]MDY8108668.1 hypothetical protein [Fulvimarina sp. 2208YS6-2-32]
MDWFATIDAYCERTDASFWSEPVNAVSNAAFVLAAAFVGVAIARGARHGTTQSAFAALVCVIGVGSFLFHTFATRWASLADVLPITLFIFAYFAVALSRFVGLGWMGTLVGTALFFGASLIVESLFAPLAGSSAAYLPALFAMLAIGIHLLARSHPAGPAILLAGAVFAVSLTLRSLDGPLCGVWPVGTHFLWHVLNAVTLAILVLALGRGPRDDGHYTRERPL